MDRKMLRSLFSDRATRFTAIDFSDSHALRVLHVHRRSTKLLEIIGHDTLKIPEGVLHEGEIHDQAALKNILREYLLKKRGQRSHLPLSAFVALPERHTFVKKLTVKITSKDDVAEAVRWEASQHIPYDINDLAFDWTVVSRDQNAYHVLVAATPRQQVQTFVDTLEGVGYTVFILEPAPVSLVRAFQHQHDFMAEPSMLLLLGTEQSFSVVVENAQFLFSAAVPFSTAQLESELLKHLQLTTQELQKAELELGLSSTRARGIIKHLIIDQYKILIERVRTIETFYQDQYHPSSRTFHLFLCGPGARIHGMCNAMAQELHHDVRLFSTPESLLASQRDREFDSVSTDFMTAEGLALHPNLII